jgi:hypothetical protein
MATEQQEGKISIPEYGAELPSGSPTEGLTAGAPAWSGFIAGEVEGLTGLKGAKILAKKEEERVEKRAKFKYEIGKNLYASILKGSKIRGEKQEQKLLDLGVDEHKYKYGDKEYNVFKRERGGLFMSGYRRKDKFLNYDPKFLEKLKTDKEFAYSFFEDPDQQFKINELIEAGYIKPGELSEGSLLHQQKTTEIAEIDAVSADTALTLDPSANLPATDIELGLSDVDFGDEPTEVVDPAEFQDIPLPPGGIEPKVDMIGGETVATYADLNPVSEETELGESSLFDVPSDEELGFDFKIERDEFELGETLESSSTIGNRSKKSIEDAIFEDEGFDSDDIETESSFSQYGQDYEFGDDW